MSLLLWASGSINCGSFYSLKPQMNFYVSRTLITYVDFAENCQDDGKSIAIQMQEAERANAPIPNLANVEDTSPMVWDKFNDLVHIMTKYQPSERCGLPRVQVEINYIRSKYIVLIWSSLKIFRQSYLVKHHLTLKQIIIIYLVTFIILQLCT